MIEGSRFEGSTKNNLVKTVRSSSPHETGWDGEQVQGGASVKTYRNVCLGMYGQWHHPLILDNKGEARYDADALSVDLSLITSNDGLHFREPVPGFTLVSRDQEMRWDRDYKDNMKADNHLLLQGSIACLGSASQSGRTRFQYKNHASLINS